MKISHPDLLNANFILPILFLEPIKLGPFALETLNALVNLEKRFNSLSNEEKLFLVALSLNLLIFSHKTYSPKENSYKNSVKKYFNGICNTGLLNPLQLTKWHGELGRTFYIVDHLDEAVDHFKQAILIAENNIKEAGALEIIQNSKLGLIESYYEQGVFFLSEDSTIDLAREKFIKALALVKPLLTHSNAQTVVESYDAHARACKELVMCDWRQQKNKKACKWALTGILMALTGLQSPVPAKFKENFISTLKQTSDLLLNCFYSLNGKENHITLAKKVDQINQIEKDFSMENIHELSQLVNEIHQYTMSKLNLLPFWQKRADLIPPCMQNTNNNGFDCN